MAKSIITCPICDNMFQIDAMQLEAKCPNCHHGISLQQAEKPVPQPVRPVPVQQQRSTTNKNIKSKPPGTGKTGSGCLTSFLVAVGIIAVCAVAFYIFFNGSDEAPSKLNPQEYAEKEIADVLQIDDAEKEMRTGDLIEQLIIESVSYTIDNADESGFHITITAPDMKELFYQFYNADDYVDIPPTEYGTYQELLMENIKGALLAGDFNTVTNQVFVERIGEEIQFTQEAVDAFYGGLISVQIELENALIEEARE